MEAKLYGMARVEKIERDRAALLAALEAIVAAADTNPFCPVGHVIEYGTAARAVIAKAKGES